MSVYEIGILGSPAAAERQALSATIGRMVADFGLAVGSQVVLHDGATVTGRDKHAAFAATYFGGSNHADVEAARQVAGSSVPIIPTVGPAVDFAAQIPDFLRGSNGYAAASTIQS